MIVILLFLLDFIIQGMKCEDKNLTYFTRDEYNDSFFSSEITEATCSATSTDVNQFIGKIQIGNTKTIHYIYGLTIPHFRANLIVEFGVLFGSDSDRTEIHLGALSTGTPFQYLYDSSNAYLNTQCSVDIRVIAQFYRTSIVKLADRQQIYIYIDEFGTDKFQTLMSLQLNIDTCHPTCKKCNDESESSCTGCDVTATANFSTGGKGTCVCPPLTFAEQGNCISSCTAGSFGEYQNICLPATYCNNWDSTKGVCSQCLSSFVLWEGQCFLPGTQCPSNYIKDTFEVCTLDIISTYINLKAYMKGTFFKKNFSEIESFKQKFSLESPCARHTLPSPISKCGDTSLFGGFLINKKGTIISFEIYDVTTMYFQITFKLYYIDFDSFPASTGIILKINEERFEIPISPSATKSNICGFEKDDIVDEYQTIYFSDNTPSDPQQYVIYILNESPIADGSDQYHGYIGIRDITVIGFDCSHPNCRSCPLDVCDYCAEGYYLQSPNNCVPCNPQCLTCADGTTCSTCLSDKFINSQLDCQCKSNTYFNTTTKTCEVCEDINCDVCSGPKKSDCSLCKLPKSYLFSDDNSCTDCIMNEYYPSSTNCLKCSTNNCLTCPNNICSFCKPDFFVLEDDNSCTDCDFSSYYKIGGNCKKCINNCLVCENNICSLCKDGYYLDSTTITCIECQKICKTCSNGSSCDTCMSSDYYLNSQQMCQCNSHTYFDITNIVCKTCSLVCKDCTGPTDTECLECADLYFQIYPQTKRCQLCPNEIYYNSSCQYCVNPTKFCMLCTTIDSSYVLLTKNTIVDTKQEYCLVCSCLQCQSNTFLYQQRCLDDCDQIGLNYQIDSKTNTCRCKDSYPYKILNSSTNREDCTQQKPFGFYCDSNNYCIKCSDNCNFCNQINCLTCEVGYYLWQGSCFSECFPSLNIIQNKSTGECQCEQGFNLTDLETPINGSSFICLLELKLISIQVYNSLLQSSGKVLPPDFTNNIIILIFNRNLTSSEFQSFSISIDIGSLVNQGDYKILSYLLNGNQIEVEVESEQNRKIRQIYFTVASIKSQVSLSNTILVSKSYSQNSSSSASLTNSFESISNNFISSDSTTSNLVDYLKQFQILCAFSNFVQVLPLIYLLRDFLPQSIKFGSLFGASLIFNITPSASEISFSQTETTVTNDNLQFLNNTLQSFGLTSNLYKSFILVHLSVIVSSLLVIFCIFFRQILKGKQYTLFLMNKILNFICSYLQSSITTALFSIAYCYNTYETISLSVFQISMNLLYILELTYFLTQKSNEYILQNSPNVFLNINEKARGAKSYLLISYIKKYLVVLTHLLFFSYHFFCPLFVSVIFCINGLYILYYRFYKTWLFNGVKVIQEILISILFGLIAYTVKLIKKINDSDVISDEDLQNSEKLGQVILIFILINILTSTLIFIIRLGISLFDTIKIIKQIKIQRQQRQKEIDDLLNTCILESAAYKNLLSTKIRNIKYPFDKSEINSSQGNKQQQAEIELVSSNRI